MQPSKKDRDAAFNALPFIRDAVEDHALMVLATALAKARARAGRGLMRSLSALPAR